jgi:transposase, IS5 family
MMAGRYAHAKQFNRHRSQLRILRIQLGRVMIAGDEQLEEASAWPLSRAAAVAARLCQAGGGPSGGITDYLVTA